MSETTDLDATGTQLFADVRGQEMAKRALTIAAAGTYVVPVGEHEAWTGEITGLRLVPFLEGSGTFDVDAIFVQSSDGTVGSARETHVTLPPVSIATDDVPTPDVDPKDVDADTGDPDPELPPQNVNPEDIRVNKGCSTTAPATPASWLMLALGLFALRLRRRERGLSAR